MNYGPYGVARYKAELCELVTVDIAAVDIKVYYSRIRY